TVSPSSLPQGLEERLTGVGVVEDGNLGGHLVGEIVELAAGRDRDQQRLGALLDRQLGDADGVVDRVKRAAEVQATDGDQPALEALPEERAAECQQDGQAESGAAARRVEGAELEGELVLARVAVTD